MDQMQSKMVSVLLNLPKSPLEDIEGYCRRRSRAARKVSAKIGLWSLTWAEKVISWHEHVLRAAKHSSRSDGKAHLSMNANLIHFHDAKWLFHMRSQWTAQNYNTCSSNRVTAQAGRTGTRLDIGCVQIRWEEGLALARSVKQAEDSNSNGKSLSIGSRIKNALNELHNMVGNLS